MTHDPEHPSEQFLRSIDIHELLPQQEPFIMVDTLVGIDENATVSETTVRPDNLFAEDGELSASGIVENVAQTCAARIGYVNKYILKTGMQIGYIGAISNFTIHELPKVGSMMTTQVVVEEEMFGVMLANATVKCGGRTLATTGIKLVVR